MAQASVKAILVSQVKDQESEYESYSDNAQLDLQLLLNT